MSYRTYYCVGVLYSSTNSGTVVLLLPVLTKFVDHDGQNLHTTRVIVGVNVLGDLLPKIKKLRVSWPVLACNACLLSFSLRTSFHSSYSQYYQPLLLLLKTLKLQRWCLKQVPRTKSSAPDPPASLPTVRVAAQLRLEVAAWNTSVWQGAFAAWNDSSSCWLFKNPDNHHNSASLEAAIFLRLLRLKATNRARFLEAHHETVFQGVKDTSVCPFVRQ